ncbi:MAG: SGNH/GDSL hydrolase family protein [Alphaproteobacteria bacterium]|nr:SGNH/GDSL hydrolase family protein [Alphaproteobacteria bacterium]
MKNVLCFGDSNTWGAQPVPSWDQIKRFELSQNWTGIAQQKLGADWNLITEGLPSRTTVIEDIVDGAHFSGISYLKPCLLSHTPLDHVVLMLGTNDFKRRFNLVAEDVAVGITRLIKEIKNSDTLAGGHSNILVICPPPLKVVGVFSTMFEGGDIKSQQLAPYIKEIAAAHGVSYLNAGEIIQSSDTDGIHLDADQHKILGEKVAEILTETSQP